MNLPISLTQRQRQEFKIPAGLKTGVCVCVVTKGKKQYFYVSSAALPLSTAQNAQNVEYFPTSEYFSCPRSFLSHASDLLKGKQIFHLSLEY